MRSFQKKWCRVALETRRILLYLRLQPLLSLQESSDLRLNLYT